MYSLSCIYKFVGYIIYFERFGPLVFLLRFPMVTLVVYFFKEKEQFEKCTLDFNVHTGYLCSTEHRHVMSWEAILVFQDNETFSMLLYQTNPVGFELFSYVTLSFVPVNLHGCSTRESIVTLYEGGA